MRLERLWGKELDSKLEKLFSTKQKSKDLGLKYTLLA